MAKSDERVFRGVLSPDCKTITLKSNEPARFIGDLLGEDIEVVIKKPRRTKSKQQLGYWFGVLVPTCRNTWAEMEGVALSTTDTHTRMMYECVGAKMVPKKLGNFNCYILDRPHLSDASVEEVSQYIEQVIQYLAEIGVEVLPPGETGTLSDY